MFVVSSISLEKSINLHVRISFLSSSNDAPKTPYAIVCGLVSIAVSSFWIGVHLNFCNMRGIKEGGWFEIFSTIFLMFMWIIGLSVFTKDGELNQVFHMNVPCTKFHTRSLCFQTYKI